MIRNGPQNKKRVLWILLSIAYATATAKPIHSAKSASTSPSTNYPRRPALSINQAHGCVINVVAISNSVLRPNTKSPVKRQLDLHVSLKKNLLQCKFAFVQQSFPYQGFLDYQEKTSDSTERSSTAPVIPTTTSPKFYATTASIKSTRSPATTISTSTSEATPKTANFLNYEHEEEEEKDKPNVESNSGWLMVATVFGVIAGSGLFLCCIIFWAEFFGLISLLKKL